MESDPKETRKEELNSWLQLIGAREWDGMGRGGGVVSVSESESESEKSQLGSSVVA